LKIAIIGAGPAGITAAYQLSKKTPNVTVYEASAQVGGLAKTIDLWNQKIDIGPHRFFSDDKRINDLWLEVVGNDYEMVNRLTRIYYKGKFFYYPLKPIDALLKLGIVEAVICFMSYVAERIIPTKNTTHFEGWVTSRFGKRLYQIFFKTYSEKLWGIPCTQLDADFAAQRIKKLSLWEAIINGLKGGKNNTHKSLVDEFAYPHGGTGSVYERMSATVVANGGQVLTNTAVKQVLVENNTAIGLLLENGETHYYDHIISSMPLTLMVQSINGVPEHIKNLCANLTYRSTILVYIKVNATNLFPDNWLYIHSADLQLGRLTNFSNWVPHINNNQKETILCLEYWSNYNDDFYTKTDEELIALAKYETKQTGLIGTAQITDGYVYRIPRCYPVYSTGYKESLLPVQEYLTGIKNMSVIGRYGAFKYNNQDHSILMGMLAADNILNNATHNLWDINTDYESYQESSIISKTGLAKS
jgi:protoporphyrinogen oxidase